MREAVKAFWRERTKCPAQLGDLSAIGVGGGIRPYAARKQNPPSLDQPQWTDWRRVREDISCANKTKRVYSLTRMHGSAIARRGLGVWKAGTTRSRQCDTSRGRQSAFRITLIPAWLHVLNQLSSRERLETHHQPDCRTPGEKGAGESTPLRFAFKYCGIYSLNGHEISVFVSEIPFGFQARVSEC